MSRLIYWWKWWKWFLGGPNSMTLILKGIDKESRRIIYDRHDEKEPRR